MIASGRLERAPSVSAGAILRPSSRGEWNAVPPNRWMELTAKSGIRLASRRARRIPLLSAAHPRCYTARERSPEIPAVDGSFYGGCDLQIMRG
jgi:hypothetical protein